MLSFFLNHRPHLRESRRFIPGLVLLLCVAAARGEETIDDLLRKLGSPQFRQRQAATQKLLDLGEPAILPLRRMSRDPDLEIRLRAERLIELIEARLFGPLRTITGHTEGIVVMAAFADGKRVLTGSNDATLKIWDFAEGSCLKTMPTKTGQVWCAAISPDEKSFAVGGGSQVRLWDAVKGESVRKFAGADAALRCLAFTPDGKHVAGGSFDERVYLWDVATGKEVRRFEGHRCSIMCLAISPDGKTLASGAAQSDRTVRLWDLETGKAIYTLSGHSERVMGLSFDRDGKRLASCGWDGTVKLWDPTNGKLLQTIKVPSKLFAVAWDWDERYLYGAGDEGTIRMISVSTGEELCCLRGHESYITQVIVCKDRRHLVTSSHDRTVGVFRRPTPRLAATR